MIKHLLLISLFLFMPFVSYGDGLVIGSSDTLYEKNLPLDTELFDRTLEKVSYCREFPNNSGDYIKECGVFYDSNDQFNRLRELLYTFILYKEGIPFSIEHLFVLCNSIGSGLHIESCVDFVFGYAQGIVERSENIPLDKANSSITEDEVI